MRRLALLTATLTLTACATAPQATHAGLQSQPVPAAQPLPQVALPGIEVQILAFNDFHGNLEVPAPVEVTETDGSKTKIETGGAARLAAALNLARARQPYTVTVSAGDTIGATPLTSALFIDEPTIKAMNLMKLEFNAVGNHEFDKGLLELKRMQQGGCIQHTRRMPCAVEPFEGAKFQYLAANVLEGSGKTVLPASAVKDFGPVKIGFIGMTLKETKNLVTPSGIAGLTFADEAATANALVPQLKAQGADAIVLLIHQGGKLPTFNRGEGCDGFYGDIKDIVAKLDPAITTVVSGHTHWAYICRGDEVGVQPRLMLTSAGKNGYMFTDIRLHFNAQTRQLYAQQAESRIVGQGQYGTDKIVQAHVDKYVAAAAPLANRVVGKLMSVAKRSEYDGESPAANLIADSMLAATRDKAKGGAQIALVNATGVRVDLPGGDVLYKDAFKMMPFGNNLVVMTLTGAEIKEAIEQQFAIPVRAGFNNPSVLAPSQGFGYTFDLSQPEGARIVGMALNGKAIDPKGNYRVVLNNYLASGGDGLKAFTKGRNIIDANIVDIDALIAWIADGRTPPAADRITSAN